MPRLTAILCAVFCAFSIHAIDIPGLQHVPPSQIKGTLLQLPELAGGSINTPGPTWEWHYAAQPNAKAYVLFDTATGNRFTLTVVDNIGLLNADTLKKFLAGMRSGIEKSGAKVVGENPLPAVTLPLHGEVHRFQFELNVNGDRVFTNGHIVQIGKKGLVLASYSPDGQDLPQTQALLSSLAYMPQAKPAAFGFDRSIMSKVTLYFVIGAVIWGLAALANALTRRDLVNGPLLAVMAVLMSAVGMAVYVSTQGQGTSNFDGGYAIGQEIGAAVWPLILYGAFASRKKKEKAPAAQNHTVAS